MSAAKNVEKKEPSCTVGGEYIGAVTMENSTEVPQKIKKRTTMRSNNPTSVYISEGNKISISKSYLHPHV